MSLKISFTDKIITPWGGMSLMKNFLDRLSFRQVINDCPYLPRGQSNRSYKPYEIIESFIVNVWLGATKFYHTQIGRFDYPLTTIFQWRYHPSDVTYRRFFNRFNYALNNQVFDYFFSWLLSNLKEKEVTLDIDSSVFTRYGSQQGAKRGYNPHKPGRPSHHPLMAFISDLNLVVNFWLRPGNSHTSNNFINFLDQTFARLRDIKVELVRLDSGFCYNNIFSHLEERDLSYIVGLRFTSTVKQMILSQRLTWYRFAPGLEYSVKEYKANGWKKKRKIILIRKSITAYTNVSDKQFSMDFLENYLDINQYRFTAFVTNINVSPEQVRSLFRSHAESENKIKELAYNLGTKSFQLNSFYATEAALNFVMLAYNLMSLFNIFLLDSDYSTE